MELWARVQAMAAREGVRIRVGHHGLAGHVARLMRHPDGRLVLLVADWVPVIERVKHASRCLAVLSSSAWRNLMEVERRLGA